MNQLWVCILMGFVFLFAMGHLSDLCSKNYEISPPQVKITFFTLLYIYIVLHSHIKSYKWFRVKIFLYSFIYLHCFIGPCKTIYKYINITLTWSVSPKPFTHTTLGLTHFHAISKLFFIHSTVKRPNFGFTLLKLRLGNLNVERLWSEK